MEPLPRGSGFEFVNEIFGGSIPRGFIPAVEKGIQEAAARGWLAGFPVVDFRVMLYRRQLPRRRLERAFLQTGRAAGLPQMHGAVQAGAA